MERSDLSSLRRKEWKAAWHVPVISALGIGVSMIPIYSLGPLMPAIHASTGWTRSFVSAGPTFLSVGAVLLSPLVGMAVDRVGSRRIAIPGLILFCAALASLSLTSHRLATWWLSWTLIAVTEVLVKITVWTTAVVKRFHYARGAAVGLALAGTGLSSFSIPYLTTLLQESYGWQTAYAVLAAGGFLLAFPFVLFFFFDGSDVWRQSTTPQELPGVLPGVPPGVPLKEAFLSRRYLQMTLAALFSAAAGTALSIHFVPILRSEGLTAHTSAAIAGGIGAALIAGGLAGGYLLDHWSGSRVGFLALALPALACPALLLFHNVSAGLFAGVLIGASAGAEINVYASIIPRYFGVRHFGLLFAVVDATITVGLGIGPFTAGYLFDRFGNYDRVLLLSVPLFLVSAVLLGTLGREPGLEGAGSLPGATHNGHGEALHSL